MRLFVRSPFRNRSRLLLLGGRNSCASPSRKNKCPLAAGTLRSCLPSAGGFSVMRPSPRQKCSSHFLPGCASACGLAWRLAGRASHLGRPSRRRRYPSAPLGRKSALARAAASAAIGGTLASGRRAPHLRLRALSPAAAAFASSLRSSAPRFPPLLRLPGWRRLHPAAGAGFSLAGGFLPPWQAVRCAVLCSFFSLPPLPLPGGGVPNSEAV